MQPPADKKLQLLMSRRPPKQTSNKKVPLGTIAASLRRLNIE